MLNFRTLPYALSLALLGGLGTSLAAQTPSAPTGELVLYGTVVVAPADRTAFIQRMGEVAIKTRSEPGCEFFTLSEDTAQKGQFYLVEAWTNREVLEAHLASPKTQAELKGVTSLHLQKFTLTRYLVAGKEDGVPKK